MTIEKTFSFGRFFLMLSVSMSFVVYGPFLRSLGFSAGDMALVNLVFQALVVAFDLVTSVFADRTGRTRAVMIGSAFLAVSLGLYAVTHTLIQAIIAETLSGIGIGFISGSLESWMKSALDKEEMFDKERAQTRHDHALRRGTLFALAARILGGVGGGLLGLFSYRLPFALEVVFILLCAPWLQRMMMAHELAHHERNKTSFSETWRIIKSVPVLPWFIASTMVASLQQVVFVYWAMTFHGWIGQTGISFMWIPMQICLTIGAYILHGSHKNFILSIFGMGVSMWLMGATHSVFGHIAAFLVFETCAGAREQLFSVLSARHVHHRILTTYRSIPMTAFRLTMSAALGLVWLCLRHTAYNQTVILHLWTLVGVIICLCSLLLFLAKPRETASPVQK